MVNIDEDKIEIVLWVREIIEEKKDTEGNVVATKTAWRKTTTPINLGSLTEPNKKIVEIRYVPTKKLKGVKDFTDRFGF